MQLKFLLLASHVLTIHSSMYVHGNYVLLLIGIDYTVHVSYFVSKILWFAICKCIKFCWHNFLAMSKFVAHIGVGAAPAGQAMA